MLLFLSFVFGAALCNPSDTAWTQTPNDSPADSATNPAGKLAADSSATTAQSPSAENPNADTPVAVDGNPEADVVTLPAIRQALRELESNELQVRDKAEKTLIAMGAAALPYLPEITPRTSGELKVRLQRVRQALQQAKIGNQFEASTVTLDGKMRLGDALEQISKQTGNPIQLDNMSALAELPIELSAVDAPFWDVMSSVMQQAKLRINPYGTTENLLVLAPGGSEAADAGANFSQGPFRLDMTSARSVLPFNSPMGGQLELSLTVTWEPRLKPVFMQLPMSSLRAEFTSGKTLAASNPQAAPEVPLNAGGCTTQIDLVLERPDRSEGKIVKLTGEFSIAVPSQRHQYVFEKFGNGARQTEKFGDVTVTLEGARRNGSVYELRIFVEFGDSQGALDSFRGWILSNEAYLRDAKDQRLENVGLNTYAVTANAVGIAYLFQINGDPNDYKLIYESPAAITTQKVEYELRDIDLP
ncbi:MAG: hypothetical protein R3C56_10585 [Pirellulaceae bacterium]